MKRIVINEQQLRNTIRLLLLESESLRAQKEVLNSMIRLADVYNLEYDPFWLSAAAMALVDNENQEKFIDFLLYSIKVSGISRAARDNNGRAWYVSSNGQQRQEILRQIARRRALVRDLRPEMSDAFGEESQKFMKGKMTHSTFTEDEKQRILDVLKDPSTKNRLMSGISKILGQTSQSTALEALSRGDFSKFLSSAVIIRPPKSFDEMTQNEKDQYEAILSGKKSDMDLFRQWSRAPEAEIIGVKLQAGAPLGLAYVYPTVTIEDSFESLKRKNKEVFVWNKANYSSIDLATPVVEMSAANFDDIFQKTGEEFSVSSEWFLTTRPTKEDNFLDILRTTLELGNDLDDSSRFTATSMVIVDLRTATPPNKVYTPSGQESAAQFRCLATSTQEMIELAFTDLNEDINVACKLAVADSLSVGFSVTVLQVMQTFLPDLIASVFFTAAAAGTKSLPAATAAANAGHLVGEISNAALVIIQNAATQLVPLAYAAGYFWRKNMKEAAAICVLRLTISLLQTVLQVGTPGLAKAITAAYPDSSLAAIFQKMLNKETVINISGLVIDFILSIEQEDFINPGSKAELLNMIKSLLDSLSGGAISLAPKDVERLKRSISAKLPQDIQKVNSLFQAFEKLRFAEIQ